MGIIMVGLKFVYLDLNFEWMIWVDIIFKCKVLGWCFLFKNISWLVYINYL